MFSSLFFKNSYYWYIILPLLFFSEPFILKFKMFSFFVFCVLKTLLCLFLFIFQFHLHLWNYFFSSWVFYLQFSVFLIVMYVLLCIVTTFIMSLACFKIVGCSFDMFYGHIFLSGFCRDLLSAGIHFFLIINLYGILPWSFSIGHFYGWLGFLTFSMRWNSGSSDFVELCLCCLYPVF